MAIGQFAFERVKRPAHVQPVWLQNIQVDRFATRPGHARLGSVVHGVEILGVFHAWYVQRWVWWHFFEVAAGAAAATPLQIARTIRDDRFVTLTRVADPLTLIGHGFIRAQVVI